MNKTIKRCYDFLIFKRPAIILLVLSIVFISLASQLGGFKVDASADSLVLENDEDLKYYRSLIARYGTSNFLAITYKPLAPRRLFDKQTLVEMRRLADDITDIPGIKTVLSLLDVPLLQSPTLRLSELSEQYRTVESEGVDLELAKQEFKNSPLYKNLLLSADGSTAMLLAYLEEDTRYKALLSERERLRALKYSGDDYSPQALAAAEHAFKEYQPTYTEREINTTMQVRQAIARYQEDNRLFLGGLPMIVTDMIAMIKNDMLVFGSAIILFLIILLGIIFRNIRSIVVAMMCALVSAIATMGLLALIDQRVSVISANFASLLMIITMSMVMHLLVRLRELQIQQPTADMRELAKQTVHFMYTPCLYAALTTIVAFISLLVSGIRPVIDFGYIMTIGIVVLFIVVFTLFPSFVCLTKKNDIHTEKDFTYKITNAFSNLSRKHYLPIIGVSVLIAIGSATGMNRLEVENRFIDYFGTDTEIYKGMLEIDRKLGGTTPFDVVLKAPKRAHNAPPLTQSPEDDLFSDYLADEQSLQNYWMSPAKIQEIKKIHNYFDNKPEVGKVLSLATLAELAEILNDGKELNDFEIAFLGRLLPSDIKKVLYEPYISEDGNEIRISMRVIDSDKNLKRKTLIEQSRQQLLSWGYDEDQFRLSGMLVLYNNMLQSLYQSQILTLGMVIAVIFLMFVILFKSLPLATIAIIPNALSASFVLGLMGWYGIPLDLMTIMLAAISIGISVDNTIHYIVRFKREYQKDRDYQAVIKRCHNSIGRAMYYTSVTIIAGFSILSLSNFNPTIYFGLLTGLAMLVALLGALILLPSLLLAFKPMKE
ncbi:MAG: MMPL family transporter [Chromatiales bacterium]|nr:MMPL family transporter [Chromatiales bacterium]